MTEREKKKAAFKQLRIIVETDPDFNSLSDYIDNEVSLGETAGAVNPLLAWHPDIERKIVPIREGQSRGGQARAQRFQARNAWLEAEDKKIRAEKPLLKGSQRAAELEKRCKQKKARLEKGEVEKGEYDEAPEIYDIKAKTILNCLRKK